MRLLDSILSYSDTYMPLFALIIFLFNRKNIEKPEKIFLVYLIISVVLFAATNVMGLYKRNNLFLYHFYYFFELVFITYYITKYLIRSFNPLFYIIIGCYSLFWILDIVLWEPLNVFSSYAAGLQRIIILFLCMYYLLGLSRGEDILNFQKLPGFWMASAFLISSAIGILSVIAYKYYTESNLISSGFSAWRIEIIATIIKFIFIIIAFVCYKRRPRSPFQFPILL